MNTLQIFAVVFLTLQVQSKVSQLQSAATWVPHTQVNVDDLTPGLTWSGANYYIGRTSYYGSVIPGTVYSTRNTLYFGSEGRERNSASYELLVYSCSDFTWVKVEANNSTQVWPTTLFPAGTDGRNKNETLFICRAWHVTGSDTAHRLGKFSKLKKTCDVPYWGGEYSYRNFEVFAVVPSIDGQSGGDQSCPCASVNNGYLIALIVSMTLIPVVAIVAFITGKRFSDGRYDHMPVSVLET